MIKDPFVRKWHDLKYLYGIEAADYFKAHPACQHCPEKRIATLTVHHTKGRQINEFETLCFNCHMIHHAKHKTFTYEDHLKFVDKKQDRLNETQEMYDKMAKRYSELKSLRLTAKEFGVSTGPIRRALARSSSK